MAVTPRHYKPVKQSIPHFADALPGSRRSTSASARAYAARMTEPAPSPTEPPVPSAEQLEEWRALVERVRQGDRSEVVSWDEVAAELGL